MAERAALHQSGYWEVHPSPYLQRVAGQGGYPLPPRRPRMERQMSKYNSNGEVYGSKALTLAMIAVSALILAGTVYSPAQISQKAAASQSQVQEVVVKAPAATPGVSG
jgi:hypothetical protein